MRPTFRPWGLLHWLLDKLPVAKVSHLGCLSTEDRSLASWNVFNSRGALDRPFFLEIKDPPSRYSQESEVQLTAQRKTFLDAGGRKEEIEVHQLFERIEELVKSVRRFLHTCGESVVIDITSFPKRFFFPIVRVLIESEVPNLFATYTVPKSYAGTPLSEDPEPWRHIPLFAPYPEPRVKVLIVGAGFETLGLPDLLEGDYQDVAVKVLFPFPPGPPTFQRTWDFVRNLQRYVPTKQLIPLHVDARDVSDAFDHILRATDNGNLQPIFAPYGPKPISLAMCLYAIQKESSVFYTQPKVYNPYYSVGTNQVQNRPQVYGYCLRLRGRNYYSFTKDEKRS